MSRQPAMTHSGMFTKKIHRHETNWLKMPPRAGPTTEEMAQTLAM